MTQAIAQTASATGSLKAECQEFNSLCNQGKYQEAEAVMRGLIDRMDACEQEQCLPGSHFHPGCRLITEVSA